MPRCCWGIQGEEERKLKGNEKKEKNKRKEDEKKRKKRITHATPERSWRKRMSLRSWWSGSHNRSTKVNQQSTDGQKEGSLPSPVPQPFEETHEGSFNSAEGDVVDVDARVALPDEPPPRVWLVLDEQYREYLAPLCAALERCVRSEMDIAVHVCTAIDDDARATSDLGIRVKVMTSMYADVPDNILRDAFPGFNHSILLIVYRSDDTSQFATNFELDQLRSGISIAHDDSYVKCFLQIVVRYMEGTPHDHEVNSHYWRELQYIVNVYDEMLSP